MNLQCRTINHDVLENNALRLKKKNSDYYTILRLQAVMPVICRFIANISISSITFYFSPPRLKVYLIRQLNGAR